MAKKPSKAAVLQIRLSDEEKAGFEAAADIGGLSLSSWVRERLRHAAIRELEAVGVRAPFVRPLPLDKPND